MASDGRERPSHLPRPGGRLCDTTSLVTSRRPGTRKRSTANPFQEGPMACLTLLLTILALALPGVALASGGNRAPAAKRALATERYYESYGRPAAVAATVARAPAPAGHAGPSWAAAAGVGSALILLAAGLGLYGGRA